MSRYMLIACATVFAALLPAPALLHAADLEALVGQIPNVDSDRDGRFTGPDPAAAEKIYLEVLKDGRAGVTGLVAMLKDPGGPDYKARYVLHGIATYVARPGTDKDRAMFCEALASTLSGDRPKPVKAFVLQELRYVGGKEVAAAVSECLADDELCQPAAQTLLAIGGTADLFRSALPAAKGKNRVTIIHALGVLRDTQAAAELAKAAGDADRTTRLAAIDALANIGDPAAAQAILAAGDNAKETYERAKATEAAMVLAGRMAEAGRKADAEKIYRHIWDTRTTFEERHMRIAALVGLSDVKGDMNDLLAAMKTGDPQIRAVALRTAAAATAPDATAKLVDAMGKALPADRASLLAILGERHDAAALNAVLSMLKDPNEQVYTAAMQAAAAIGGAGAAEALLADMDSRTGKDRDAAAAALAKARGPEAGAAIGAAMKKAADPAMKASLIGVVAARRDSGQADAVAEALDDNSAPVRLAAIKALGVVGGDRQLAAVAKILKATGDKGELAAAEAALTTACGRGQGDAVAGAVVPAMTGAPAANAAAMLRVLGASGSRKALDAVAAQAKGSGEARDAAVRALADWRNKDAAPALLEIARTAENPTHKVLAIRGVIRLASLKDTSKEDKQRLLGDAMKAATRPEDKREVLGALTDLQTVEAMRLAAACLDDEAVKEEAAAAVVKIGDKLAKKSPDAVRDAVGKAAKVAKNEGVRKNAERILGDTKK